MKIENVKELLESIDGFENKVAFYEFPEDLVPPLPFICFICTDDNNFSADGIVYHAFTNFAVELYTQYKDEETEEKVEQTFTEHGIYYTKETTYLDDEKVWLIVYEMEL